jgi:phage shock protein E
MSKNQIAIRLAASLLVAGAVAACQSATTPGDAPTSGAAAETTGTAVRVDGAAAREAIEAGAMLVDVRTPEEFEAGHIDGAVNVPVDQVGASSAFDGQEQLVVYCRSGRRSAAAAQQLAGMGFEVLDLGPMSAW